MINPSGSNVAEADVSKLELKGMDSATKGMAFQSTTNTTRHGKQPGKRGRTKGRDESLKSDHSGGLLALDTFAVRATAARSALAVGPRAALLLRLAARAGARGAGAANKYQRMSVSGTARTWSQLAKYQPDSLVARASALARARLARTGLGLGGARAVGAALRTRLRQGQTKTSSRRSR